MQHVDAAAVHTGPAKDVLNILKAAQEASEVGSFQPADGFSLCNGKHLFRKLMQMCAHHPVGHPHMLCSGPIQKLMSVIALAHPYIPFGRMLYL